MAALIRKGRRIVSAGLNSKKTHPLQAKYGNNRFSIHLHAEIAAILRASEDDLEGSTLYVARSLKDGSRALAKPCEGCQRAIKDFKIKRVVYTTEKGYSVWYSDL